MASYRAPIVTIDDPDEHFLIVQRPDSISL